MTELTDCDRQTLDVTPPSFFCRVQKRAQKVRLPSAGNIRDSKELLLLDLEKLRLKDGPPKAEHLQVGGGVWLRVVLLMTVKLQGCDEERPPPPNPKATDSSVARLPCLHQRHTSNT